MNRTRGAALYLGQDSSSERGASTRAIHSPRSKVKVLIFGFIAMAMLFAGFTPVLSSTQDEPAQAYGQSGFLAMFCGGETDLGSNMNNRGKWMGATQRYAEMDATNRTWTAQELFSGNLAWPHYKGEGPEEATFFIRGTGEDVDRPAAAAEAGQIDQSVADYVMGDAKDKVFGLRTVSSCFGGGLSTMMANGVLQLSSAISSWTGIFATAAFDSSLICSDADQTGCFNLVKIIGGGDGPNDDGGVIGTLTSSIYFPLLSLGVLITAITLAHMGLIQGRIREALIGAIWMLGAIILGAALLLNPQLIAKAPMSIPNGVGTCIIGAFNGDSCLSDSSGNIDQVSTSDEICKSEADVNVADSMTLAVNGMSCSIWKAFVLEPYAQGSFGYSFDALDMNDSPSDKLTEQMAAAGIDDPASTFEVNLGSSKSGEEMEEGTAELNNSPSVSNVALYQLYLMTDAKSGSTDLPAAGAVDGRWYNIVAFTAADDATWNVWASSWGGNAVQLALAATSLTSSVLGGAVIILTSSLALVYYVISIVLVAVAPLFLLIAIHPGRGKQIFLGWFGQIVGNILKYIASAFFLVITVALYSGVLANSENLATTFLFILILSAALLLYRSEIVNLLGRVDLASEKLSSRMGDAMKERAGGALRGTRNAALGAAGAAVGGAITTGKGAKPSEYFKNAASGIKDNASRELKRKSGFAGNIARQADRVSSDNRRDLRAEASKQQVEANAASSEASSVESEASNARADYENTEAQVNTDKASLQDFNARAEVKHRVEHEVLSDMSTDNPAFVKAQELTNKLDGLKMEHTAAVAAGNTAEATKLQGEMATTQKEMDAARGQVTHHDQSRGERRYNTYVRKGMESQGVEYSSADRTAHEATNARVAAEEPKLAAKRTLAEGKGEEATRARAKADALAARQQTSHDKSQEWLPGDKMTTSSVKQTGNEGDIRAREAYVAAGGDVKNFEKDTGIKIASKGHDKAEKTVAKADAKAARTEEKEQEQAAKYREKQADKAKSKKDRQQKKIVEEFNRTKGISKFNGPISGKPKDKS